MLPKGDSIMNLERLIKRVSEELDTSFPEDMSAEDQKKIRDIFRTAMLDAAKRTHREMNDTAKAVIASGHEADLAHKIEEQMAKKRGMLVANLTAMR